MGGDGGGDCGGDGSLGSDPACGPPVTEGCVSGIVQAAGGDAGTAYVGDYKITRDGITRHPRPKTEIKPKD